MGKSLNISMLLVMILIAKANGLKCYQCNTRYHRPHCQLRPNFTYKNTEFVVDCSGTCVIGAARHKLDNPTRVVNVFLRACDNEWNIPGCNSTDTKAVCRCNRDFCNYVMPAGIMQFDVNSDENGSPSWLQSSSFTSLIIFTYLLYLTCK